MSKPNTCWVTALYKGCGINYLFQIVTEKKDANKREHYYNTSRIVDEYGTAISNHAGLEGFSKNKRTSGQRYKNFKSLDVAVSLLRKGTLGPKGNTIMSRLVTAKANGNNNFIDIYISASDDDDDDNDIPTKKGTPIDWEKLMSDVVGDGMVPMLAKIASEKYDACRYVHTPTTFVEQYREGLSAHPIIDAAGGIDKVEAEG